jgi:3',5'-nucleoside bisphosphate phosphatase
MPGIYDLHAHTLHSDGSLSPAELVTRAGFNGVTTLAITDHDVTDGVAEAQTAGRQLGVEVLPGVEISVTWQRQTLHVVGLGIDAADVSLQQGLARLREFRRWRALEIDRRLRRKNIAGAYEYVRRVARGAVLSRTHFAQFLMEHGYVTSTGQAFKQYLGDGCAAHVPGQWAELEQALGWIRAAGGTAVLAHPARYKLTASKWRRLLGEFKESGGQGIEVVSGSHTPQDNAHYARIAFAHDLLASVGSDYHGPEKPWTELGRLPPLPPQTTPIWASRGFRECT